MAPLLDMQSSQPQAYAPSQHRAEIGPPVPPRRLLPILTCRNGELSHAVDCVPPAALGKSVSVPLRDTTSTKPTAAGDQKQSAIAPSHPREESVRTHRSRQPRATNRSHRSTSVNTHAPSRDDHRPPGHLVILGSGPQAEWEHAMERLAARGPLLLINDKTPTWQRKYLAGARTANLLNATQVLEAARKFSMERAVSPRALSCFASSL